MAWSQPVISLKVPLLLFDVIVSMFRYGEAEAIAVGSQDHLFFHELKTCLRGSVTLCNGLTIVAAPCNCVVSVFGYCEVEAIVIVSYQDDLFAHRLNMSIWLGHSL